MAHSGMRGRATVTASGRLLYSYCSTRRVGALMPRVAHISGEPRTHISMGTVAPNDMCARAHHGMLSERHGRKKV